MLWLLSGRGPLGFRAILPACGDRRAATGLLSKPGLPRAARTLSTYVEGDIVPPIVNFVPRCGTSGSSLSMILGGRGGPCVRRFIDDELPGRWWVDAVSE